MLRIVVVVVVVVVVEEEEEEGLFPCVEGGWYNVALVFVLLSVYCDTRRVLNLHSDINCTTGSTFALSAGAVLLVLMEHAKFVNPTCWDTFRCTGSTYGFPRRRT